MVSGFAPPTVVLLLAHGWTCGLSASGSSCLLPHLPHHYRLVLEPFMLFLILFREAASTVGSGYYKLLTIQNTENK